MTRSELESKIKNLRSMIFMTEMDDHLTAADYEWLKQNKEVLSDLEGQLNDMTKPKVSVIVPVYNGEKYLDECIRSIAGQTLKEIEIICVDDGSTDGSREIIDEWRQKDERVKVFLHPNMGTGYTVNEGILMARGEYIAEVDCDDWIAPDMYEKLYEVADGADVVKSGYYSYYDKERDYPCKICEKAFSFKPLKADYMTRYHLFGFQPSFWSAIYRTEFIRSNELYWNETPGASFQDTSIIFKINALAEKVVCVPEVYYHWRVSDSHSITSTKWPDAVIYEYNCIEKFLKERPELQLQLRYILSRLRFGTFCWNYSRIADEDKLDFAIKAAEEMRRDLDYQDVRYYSEGQWSAYLAWMSDPELFHAGISRLKEEK